MSREGTGLAADAFPGDPTAWLDTDGDGYPDFTLYGSSLTIDAFPLDAAAWRDTDGDGRPDELLAPSSTGLSEDLDDDNDCMPDAWENACYLNSKDWTDSAQVVGGPGPNGICEMWEHLLYCNGDLWRENGGVRINWPRVTFALSGAVGSPSPATLVIGGQEFPLEHRGQGFSLLIPPGRTLALELRDAPGIAVAVTSGSCIVLGGDLYYGMLFCVSDPVFATLHAPRLTLGDGSGSVCIHGEGQAVCASVSSNLFGDIAWTQNGQTVGTGPAVTSSALSQGPLTATFLPAGGNGVPCSAQAAVGFCKLCRCEHGFLPPDCAICYALVCPKCGSHANHYLKDCPCMYVGLPPVVPLNQSFTLSFGFDYLCSASWRIDACCGCPGHGQRYIGESHRHKKECDVVYVSPQLTSGLPGHVVGAIESSASCNALSTRFDDTRVVGHVTEPPFETYETCTGSVTVASIGFEAPGPFSADGAWLVRGSWFANAFTVRTDSRLEEGSVRLLSQDRTLSFWEDGEGAPAGELKTGVTNAPPATMYKDRTFWLRASEGGVTPGLSYALLRPQGYALIVSNLAVEAVMVRLPVYDYYAAYGSAAPLQVALDPVSHDPAGYSVLVDGAVAACSNQPPFHIDTSALDVGVHTVTVRCETFPDLESIAALVVVKMGIDRAEANLAWTVQSASLQLSWDPWGVPNDTVSWSVSPSGLSYTPTSGDVFTFSPTNSEPGEYTVTAASDILPECATSCVVRVFKVDLDVGDGAGGGPDGDADDPEDGVYGFIPGNRGNAEVLRWSGDELSAQPLKLVAFAPGCKYVWFNITACSALEGYCANTTLPDTVHKDFNFGIASDGGDLLTDCAVVSDGKAVADLYCKDFGGWCTVKVSFQDASERELCAVTLDIPRDDNLDGVADAWQEQAAAEWQSQYGGAAPGFGDARFAPENDLEDEDPDGGGWPLAMHATKGDGYTVWQEYRGYQFGGDVHRRLSPARKELLVEVDNMGSYTGAATRAEIEAAMSVAQSAFHDSAGARLHYVIDEESADHVEFTSTNVVSDYRAAHKRTKEKKFVVYYDQFRHLLFCEKSWVLNWDQIYGEAWDVTDTWDVPRPGANCYCLALRKRSERLSQVEGAATFIRCLGANATHELGHCVATEDHVPLEMALSLDYNPLPSGRSIEIQRVGRPLDELWFSPDFSESQELDIKLVDRDSDTFDKLAVRIRQSNPNYAVTVLDGCGNLLSFTIPTIDGNDNLWFIRHPPAVYQENVVRRNRDQTVMESPANNVMAILVPRFANVGLAAVSEARAMDFTK